MIIAIIIAIFLSALLLIKAADIVILALNSINKKTRAGSFAISAIILAIGTSFPELFVGITSALEGTSQLSFGNIIGANIANLAFISGISGIWAKKIKIRGGFLSRDIWIAIVAGLSPIVFILDGAITRPDGFVLIAIYFAYALGFFRERFMQIRKGHKPNKALRRFLRKLNHIDSTNKKIAFKLLLGITLLLTASELIVFLAKLLANEAGISVFVIGLIILSLGTSLPELAFSIHSIRKRQIGLFLGNVLGSVIANSTLILGIVSLIRPIEVESINQYTIAALSFLLVSITFWYFARSKHRLDRWESGLLLTIYIVFIILSFN